MRIFIFLTIISLNSFAVMDKETCATIMANALKAENPSAEVTRIRPYWVAVCDGLIETVKTATITNSGSCTVAGGSSSGVHPTAGTGVIQ